MRIFFLIPVLLLWVGATAQKSSVSMQITVQSAIHPQGGKLTLYQEWPQRKKMDTLIAKNGIWHLQVQGEAPAVYEVQLTRPYRNTTLYLEEGSKTVIIKADSSLQVEGGALQQQLEKFEMLTAPLYKRSRQTGTAYSAEKDMEIKLLLGEKNRLIYDSIMKINMDFIRRNADNINGIWVAEKNLFAWNIGDVRSLLNIFSNHPAARPLIAALQQKEQQLNVTQIEGSPMPAFSLAGINGQLIKADSLVKQHRYVLIDFWASWCAPCRATNRKLAPLYEELKKKGIEVVSVSVDEDRKAWTNAIVADKIPWLQLRADSGMKSAVVASFKVSSLPSTFLIDQQGVISKQNISHEALQALISSGL